MLLTHAHTHNQHPLRKTGTLLKNYQAVAFERKEEKNQTIPFYIRCYIKKTFSYYSYSIMYNLVIQQKLKKKKNKRKRKKRSTLFKIWEDTKVRS